MTSQTKQDGARSEVRGETQNEVQGEVWSEAQGEVRNQTQSATQSETSIAEQVAQNFDESISLESPHSIGVDIVEISRMRRILERTPSFKTRVFSEQERAYCQKTARPECHYATRFAAKEAVLKALGTGFSGGIGVRDIEVLLNAKGKPRVKLYGRAAEKARELGIKAIPISLSYTQDDAVACALALASDPDEQPETQDPVQQLRRQFKEARSMLDEL